MKKLKVFSISAILIAICCSFLFSASVSAASKKRNKFDHKPSGNIYYYDENGHTVKGLVTIRGKKYYFNEKGIQQNGVASTLKHFASRTAGRRSKEIIISSRSATAVMPPW